MVRAAVGAAAVGVALLVVGIGSADLVGGAAPRSSVDVDLPRSPAGSALSEDEATDLVEQADPDRLRCEPRGSCELWRLRVDDHLPGSGAVVVDDELVLLLAPGSPGDAPPAAGRREVLTAVEVATGDRRWEFPVEEAVGTASSAPVRLVPGADGALLVSQTGVTAIGADGHVAWRWLAEFVGAGRRVWDAATVEDVVIVVGPAVGTDAPHSVTALEGNGGSELWSEDVHDVEVLGEDLVVVSPDEQRLRSLDPTTGAARWDIELPLAGSVRLAGPWMAVATTRNTTLLLDPASGEEVGVLDDHLISELVATGDGQVGVTADTRAWVVWPRSAGEIGVLEVVMLALDGSVVWAAPLGTHDPWWGCCEVRVVGSVVTIGGADQGWEFDVASGELLSTDATVGPGSAAVGRSRSPTSDVTILRHRDGQGLEFRGPAGTTTVRGSTRIVVESFAPPVVRDGPHLIGVAIARDDRTGGSRSR